MINKKPIVVERFADNGEHSHWELRNGEDGKLFWEEEKEEDMKSFILKIRKLEKEILDLKEEIEIINCEMKDLKWELDVLSGSENA